VFALEKGVGCVREGRDLPSRRRVFSVKEGRGLR